MIRESVQETGGDDARQSTRPSLVRLSLDVEEDVIHGPGGLLEGFASVRALVEWAQRTLVRTLGELPQRFITRVGRWIASPGEPVALAVLLQPDGREHSLADEFGAPGRDVEAAVREERRLVRQTYIEPAFDRAYERLREAATDYTDLDVDGEHNPHEQRYIAMRPGLDELDGWQADTLAHFMDGLDRERISDWGHLLEAATHGEPVVLPSGEDVAVSRFADRILREGETERVVTGGEQYEPERIAIAARLLLPAFNRGVRRRFGFSGEAAAADSTNDDKPGSWEA